MAESKSQTEGPTLWRNTSFHLLWSSTLASGFGDRMIMLTALVILGANLTTEIRAELGVETASIQAAVALFFWAPYVFWGPFAGWLADRLPRKWLMFVSDECRGLVVLLALTLVPSGFDAATTYDVWIDPSQYGLGFLPMITHAWKVYLVIFLIGVFAATFNPARTSIIPSVVGMKWLQTGNSLALSFGVIGNMIGFGVGGVMGQADVRWFIFMGATAFIVSGAVWAFLKTPYARVEHGNPDVHVDRKPFRPVGELVDGVKYILHHGPLRTLVLVSIVFWTGSAVVEATLAYLTDNLPDESALTGVAALSVISGALGVGMLIGAFILGWMNNRVGSELVIVVGLIGSGISFAVLASLRVIWVMVPAAFISGVFGGILLIAITTSMQRMTANKVLGRVIGARDMVSEILKLVVLFLIWQVAGSRFYMQYVMWFMCAVLIGVGVWGYIRYVMGGPFISRFHNVIVRTLHLYGEVWHRRKAYGKHHIPVEGPVILLANHTCSVDPFLIQPSMGRAIRWIMLRHYKLKILEFFWKTIDPILVDRTADDAAVARQAIKVLKDGEPLGLFPEGHINMDREKLAEFKPGIALIAKRSKAPIVPTFIHGTPHSDNVYLAYLIPSRSSVFFGRPFTYKELEVQVDRDIENGVYGDREIKGAEKLEIIAGLMRDRVESLRPRPDLHKEPSNAPEPYKQPA